MKKTNLLPLIVAFIIYGVISGFYINASIQNNEGNFVYALDDSYIHMAISKNLAQYGTWGFSEGEFASASSSPLWTLIIAVFFKLFGINEMLPLYMNLLFGFLIIAVLYKCAILAKFKLFDIYLMLILAILLIPLPIMTILGMEHNLHILLSILFVYSSSVMILKIRDGSKFNISPFLLAPFLAASRFEGLFSVIAVALYLVYMKKFSKALLICILGAIPIIVLGLVSKSNGWFFLPTSLVIKGNAGGLGGLKDIVKLFANFIYQPFKFPFVLPVIAWNVFLLYKLIREKKTLFSMPITFLLLFTLTFFAHSHVSRFGWLYRYEAYLFALGIFSFFIAYRDVFDWQEWKPLSKSLVFILMIFSLFLVSERYVGSYRLGVSAPKNIYRQQYQTGLFLRDYYNSKKIVINDIGAPTFLAEFEIIDPYGLATKELAFPIMHEREKTNADSIRSFVRHQDADLAIVYSHFHIDSNWIICGSWYTPDNEICAEDSVLVFAINPDIEHSLKMNFREFSLSMPADIEARPR